MKKLILAALISSSASAFMPAASEMPNSSDWAKGMTSMACKTDFPASFTGSIEEVDGGVVYTVMNEAGEEVAAASASSTFILASKTCL